MDDKQNKETRKRERELSDICTVIMTPEGRRFYWRVMEECKAFQLSFVGDTNATMFNEGKRSIGLWAFHELLEAKPSAFQQMQREHKSAETLDDIEHKEKLESQEGILTRAV